MFTIAEEMVQHQYKDSFPDSLSDLITDIYIGIDGKRYKDNRQLIEKHEAIKKIEGLIKSRFGLTVVIDKILHRYSYAAIIPFFSNDITDLGSITGKFSFTGRGILSHLKGIEEDRRKTVSKLHNKKGEISFKLAKVRGYLAEVKHYLLIDFFYLRSVGLSPREVSAIILHELGHAFTGLETHHKLYTTNENIAEVLSCINNGDIEKAKYVYKSKYDDRELSKITIEGTDEVVDLNGKIILTYMNEIRSTLINSKYDDTSYEYMADSFATRFGLGKELVTSLDSIYRNSGTVYTRGDTSSEIGNYVWTLFILMGNLMLTVGGVTVALVLLDLLLPDANDSHMTYDDPINRYNRIKQNMIKSLKDENLPDDITRNYVEQIEAIDKILSKTKYLFDTAIPFYNSIIPSLRRNQYYIDLQRDIENSLNNSLFTKAAKLKTL